MKITLIDQLVVMITFNNSLVVKFYWSVGDYHCGSVGGKVTFIDWLMLKLPFLISWK